MLGLMEIRPHVSYRGYWDFDGFQETGFLHTDVHWEWRNGYEFHTGYNIIKDGITEPFEIIDDVWVEPGTYRDDEVQLVLMTDGSAPLSFWIRTNVGGRFGGDRVNVAPGMEYRLNGKFSSSISVNYNDYDLPVPGGDFSGWLARLRLSYSFTPKILLQALVQYNDYDDELSSNLRFSWLRTANTGLYIVYNEFDERSVGAPPRDRELIVKYSYQFDVFQ
jgi:hypothetical protein